VYQCLPVIYFPMAWAHLPLAIEADATLREKYLHTAFDWDGAAVH
jgi:hypothetical protein